MGAHTWNHGVNWLDTGEAAVLAVDYVNAYDPEKRKISLLTRDWVSEVTQIPEIQLVSRTRMRQAVLARQLWATVMFAAGYSYPQIARAQMRKCHSTVIHLLHHKKMRESLVGYQRVAVKFGSALGKRRMEYLDTGANPLLDPLHYQRGYLSKDSRELRVARIRALEHDLEFVSENGRIVNDHPVFLRGLISPNDETMDDLAARMVKEAQQ